MTPRTSIAAAGSFFTCTASGALTSPAAPLAVPARISTGGDFSSVSGQQLADLIQQIQAVTDRAKATVAAWPECQLVARPRPGSWSAVECLDHLAQTTNVFLPPIADGIKAAPKLTSPRWLRTGAVAGILIRSLEPPYRLKHKVLPALEPRHYDFPGAWTAFLESQRQFIHTICSAAGLAIDKAKIQSPVCARVSYNVFGALGILAAHQRRHLWQAEQALKTFDRRTA